MLNVMIATIRAQSMSITAVAPGTTRTKAAVVTGSIMVANGAGRLTFLILYFYTIVSVICKTNYCVFHLGFQKLSQEPQRG
jgi:hypothetical protein